jgi:hypothetical protein
MSCGKKCSCSGNCSCKKGLGEQDALTQMRARHKEENWMASYFAALLVILAVVAVALHPIVTYSAASGAPV